MAFSKRFGWAWFVGLLLLAGFLVNSVSSYIVSRSNVRETISESALPLTSDNIYSEIQRDLLQPIFISSLMASDTFLRDWVLEGEPDIGQITKYLHGIKKDYNVITSFFVSEKSRKYYHADGLLKTIDETAERDEWYFRVANMAEPFEINLDIDLANQDEHTIFVNYRVFDYDGQFIGATGVGLTVNRVNTLIRDYEERFDRDIYFINKKGDIVLSPSSSDDESSNILERDWIKEHASGILDGSIEKLQYNHGNEEYFLNSRYLPRLDWFLIVEQSEDIMLAPLRKNLLTNILLAILITAIVSTICVIAIQRAHRKLQRRNDELLETNSLIESQKKELELASSKLEKANMTLSNMNTEKDEFLGIVAHDLKNPLFGILGLCDIAETNPSFDMDAFVCDVRSSGEKMTELIQNLLDVSYIESFQDELKLEPVSIHDFLLDAFSPFKDYAAKKGIVYELDLGGEASLELDTHVEWLHICLGNLISNAIKYSPSHGLVRVESALVGDHYELSVKDSGPGISSIEKKRLFKKFERLSSIPTGGESSTGLGLYIVKKMCDRMGIEIKVESSLRAGSCFTLVLPLN